VRVTTAFKRLMDLPGVTVSDVEFQPAMVVVAVKLSSKKLHCPASGFTTRARYDTRPVPSTWRHLDLGRWRLEVRAILRRINCPTHGARTEGVPFARGGAHFTRDFEDLIGWLATSMDKTALCRLVRIDWDTVGRIIERVMATGLDPRRLDNLFVAGVDEVSWQGSFLPHLGIEQHHRQVRLGQGGEGHCHPGLLLCRVGRRAIGWDHRPLDGHGPRLREVREEAWARHQGGHLLRSVPCRAGGNPGPGESPSVGLAPRSPPERSKP